MYGLISRLRAASGKRDDLATILAPMGGMPGCVNYLVALDQTDPDAIWITEVWESADAHAASLEIPAVRDAIAAGRPLIAGFDQRVETKPVSAG